MSNPSLSLRPTPRGAPHRPSLEPNGKPKGSRLKTAGLTLLREIRAFAKAVGSSNLREEMLESANQVAATQPELARRLRRAARSWWY